MTVLTLNRVLIGVFSSKSSACDFLKYRQFWGESSHQDQTQPPRHLHGDQVRNLFLVVDRNWKFSVRRATHYMIFSFSAFAAFLLISYYATSTSTKEVASYRNSYLALHQDRGKVIDHKSANSKRHSAVLQPLHSPLSFQM